MEEVYLLCPVIVQTILGNDGSFIRNLKCRITLVHRLVDGLVVPAVKDGGHNTSRGRVWRTNSFSSSPSWLPRWEHHAESIGTSYRCGVIVERRGCNGTDVC